jgi:hypothetical protein
MDGTPAFAIVASYQLEIFLTPIHKLFFKQFNVKANYEAMFQMR